MSGIYSKYLSILGKDAEFRGKKKYELDFLLAGGRSVIPYLWSINRFIWKDKRADIILFLQYQKVFSEYISTLNWKYKNLNKCKQQQK